MVNNERTEEGKELIGEFTKNSLETVRVNLQDYQGQRYLDVRVWRKDSPVDPEAYSTKKGITLNISCLPDLKKLIDRALARISFEPEPKSMAKTESKRF